MFDIGRRIITRLLGYIFLGCLSLFAICTGRTIFVIVRPFGDLGNRLFLFANLIAFAMEHDAIVLNPAFSPWRNAFAGTRPGVLASYPPAPWPHFPGELIERFIQKMAYTGESIVSNSGVKSKWASIRLSGNECCYLASPGFVQWVKRKYVVFASGWLFLSSEYMKNHCQDINGYFGRVNGKSSASPHLLQPLRSSCDLVVGVLIRHGDYRHFMGGKYFFPTSSYIRWIRQTKDLFPGQKVGFFITGNDDVSPEGIDDIPHVFRSHSDTETRFLLSECDYIISTVSSFAGWAAYLGQASVFILSSENEVIKKEGFRRIFNHPDMRDDSFPADQDVTKFIIEQRSLKSVVTNIRS